MSNFNIFLPAKDYSWINTCLWGNFIGHCKKISKTSGKERLIHVLIAATEFFPIFSQITSLIEKNIAQVHYKSISILKIQRVARRYLGRIALKKEKRHFLDYALFEKAKPYIDDDTKLRYLPQVADGRSLVYLPKKLPIVLKLIGVSSKKRFNKMRKARDICIANDYRHLIVPLARVYGKFIVESRLTVMARGIRNNIGFYIDNMEKFNAAVAEFTSFLCQTQLRDVTGGTNNPYESLSRTPIGRYDNVILTLEDDESKIGKIGLVDLEDFSPEPNAPFNACKTAIYLFPYHFEIIINAAEQFGLNIKKNKEKLRAEQKKVLDFFSIVYENHLYFVKSKGISLNKPTAPISISTDRIIKLMEVACSTLNQEYTNLLNEKMDQTTLNLFMEAFPNCLKLISDFISQELKRNDKRQNNRIITSYTQLLGLRTVIFSTQHVGFYGGKLIENIASTLTMIELSDEQLKFELMVLVTQSVFEELAIGGEIFYYNRHFGYDSYQQCIFC